MSEPATPYEAMGGEAGVRALVDAFYRQMDTRPQAATIRAMHPADITSSNTKLFEFLSGWLGGPPIYIQKRGHPRLRARHMPFPIDDDAAEQWMACMRAAFDEVGLDPQLRPRLEAGFSRIARHMRNQ